MGLIVLLPWLLGLCWLWPLRRNMPLWLGYGYLLGMLAMTGVVRAWGWFGVPLNGALLAVAVAVLSGLGLLVMRSRRPVAALPRRTASDGWQRLAGALLVVLLLVRFADLASELWLRPLTPWDAWTTWGLRARIWSDLGRLVPFVSPQQWLQASTHAHTYTIAAWNYPWTVSLIQAWAALVWGHWWAAAANLPWLGCALAFGFGFYGQARHAGANPLGALLGVFLLLTLPLLDTHVALAGYADLWLMACYGMAAMALLQWLGGGGRWQFILALLLALACPLIKLEGAVWAVLLVPLLLLKLPGRWSVVALVAGLAAGVAWYLHGGLNWGSMAITPEQVQLPYVGHYEFRYTDVWTALADNLLLQGSWHLFWYLVPVLLLLAVPRIARERQVAANVLLVIMGLGMLYVLFFYTNAAQWAENGTSVNRLFLHLAPVVAFLVVLLLRPASDKALQAVSRPDQ